MDEPAMLSMQGGCGHTADAVEPESPVPSRALWCRACLPCQRGAVKGSQPLHQHASLCTMKASHFPSYSQVVELGIAGAVDGRCKGCLSWLGPCQARILSEIKDLELDLQRRGLAKVCREW
jgi:hypothetical protein